jgi:hypothetical protein
VEKTGVPGENHWPAAFGKFYKSFLVQNIPNIDFYVQKINNMISISMEKEIKKKKHTSRSDTWYNLWKEEESLLFSLFIPRLKKTFKISAIQCTNY